jgi:hypothetical protein
VAAAAGGWEAGSSPVEVRHGRLPGRGNGKGPGPGGICQGILSKWNWFISLKIVVKVIKLLQKFVKNFGLNPDAR